jgi:chromosome segregation ATPase
MASESSTQVIQFALKQEPDDASSLDDAGQAIVALLGEAAKISNEKTERAMTAAHRLAMQLRDAEDRIAQLQAEVERLQSRAARAEQWLETIRQQIQDTLIGPLQSSNRRPVEH